MGTGVDDMMCRRGEWMVVGSMLVMVQEVCRARALALVHAGGCLWTGRVV